MSVIERLENAATAVIDRAFADDLVSDTVDGLLQALTEFKAAQAEGAIYTASTDDIAELRMTHKQEITALGILSAELAIRADAWNGHAPNWFPEPPEWLELWNKAKRAAGAV